MWAVLVVLVMLASGCGDSGHGPAATAEATATVAGSNEASPPQADSTPAAPDGSDAATADDTATSDSSDRATDGPMDDEPPDAGTAPAPADEQPDDGAHPDDAGSADGGAQPDDATAATDDLFPDVLAAEAVQSPDGTWSFSATLSSPYDTPDRYADAWRVLDPDGNELGVRVLTHDHANEQPFTRSLSGVEIPDHVAVVTVEGRDQNSGWGGATVEVTLDR